jgi:hypothetical protein
VSNRIVGHLQRYQDVYQLGGVILAMAISLVSLGYSCQANRNSKGAARPYLSLDFVPENGRFLRARIEGTNYVLSSTLRLKNFGQTPAVCIRFADYVIQGHSQTGEPEQQPFPEPPGVVSIASGDEQTGVFGFRFPVEGNLSNLMEQVESGSFHMGVEIVVEYQGPFSSREKYYTGIYCDLYGNNRVIKGSSIR